MGYREQPSVSPVASKSIKRNDSSNIAASGRAGMSIRPRSAMIAHSRPKVDRPKSAFQKSQEPIGQ